MTQSEIRAWLGSLQVGDTVGVHSASLDSNQMFEAGAFCYAGEVCHEFTDHVMITAPQRTGFILVRKVSAWSACGACIRPYRDWSGTLPD